MPLPRSYDDVPMNWVGDWIGRRALYTPNLLGLVDTGSNRRFTFAELNERADRLGAYLVDELGMVKGDRLCILTRNRVEAVDLYFACGKLGIILSPLSYYLQVPELEDLMNRLQPKAIFYEDKFLPIVEKWKVPPSVEKQIEFGDDDRYEKLILSRERRNVNVPLSMNDTFLYIHTGGTTAVPKICIVPYRQMLWNSFETLCMTPLSKGGLKILVSFPFFHIGGWNVFTPAIHAGETVYIMREFDADLVIDLIENEGISSFGGVEVMLRFIQASPKFASAKFESLDAIMTAAAPCSKEVVQPFWDKGIPTMQAYGLTEGGPSNFMFVPKTESMDEVIANTSKIGTPMFHTDYRLVDPETRQDVKVGEIGVICIRSPHVFGGYLNDIWRTEKLLLEDQWVYTGDMAFEDENGNLEIVGRADNMFISGGENVSPEEVEQTLKLHPAVNAVLAAGIKDETWGQVPVALVVLRPDQSASEEELLQFCRQHLAKFKVPRAIKLVSMIPVTGAGKPDRKILQGMFA
jgi:fatty-acyl-CoA synthase